MKPFYKLFSAGALATALFITGCDKQKDEADFAPAANSASSNVVIGPYTVSYLSFSVDRDPSTNKVFTTYNYTIQRTGRAQSNGLSHWIIGLNASCGATKELSYADVESATLDGESYNNELAGTEGRGAGCTNAVGASILKFDNLPGIVSDGQVHTYSFTLKGEWGISPQSTWVKYGKKCDESIITGPGCPTVLGSACSLSQGYWFAKPGVTWPVNAVVGGHTYSRAEGLLIWKTGSVGKPNFHSNNARKAFLQLTTLRLSAAADMFDESQAPELAAAIATVEAYLASVPKLTVTINPTNGTSTVVFPPNSNDGVANSNDNFDAGRAAGEIGAWISSHHCQNEPVID
jgi:hypothetical protein